MIVIDSCAWIHAFLKTDKKCIFIVDEVLSGDIKKVR